MTDKHASNLFRFDGYVTAEFSVRRPETDTLLYSAGLLPQDLSIVISTFASSRS